MSLTAFLKHIGTDDKGATAVEYGLIVSLIVLAMVGALGGLANETSRVWSEVETAATDAQG